MVVRKLRRRTIGMLWETPAREGAGRSVVACFHSHGLERPREKKHDPTRILDQSK